MATRIRLQRHGKKGKPFFHLVAADSRAKRDGKFIEKLGTYNPTANPAVIDINFDATLAWVQSGAEMTDTARAILSYKGVLYKNHLLNGVKKGALTAEQVEERFNQWITEKSVKIDSKISSLAKNADKEKAARLAAEKTANETKAAEILAKNNPVEEEVVAEEAPVAEETLAEEAPTTEEAVAEEAPATEEAVAEEAPATEEAVAEEAPATEEAVAEEAPATEEAVAKEVPATEEAVAEEAPATEEASTEEASEDQEAGQ